MKLANKQLIEQLQTVVLTVPADEADPEGKPTPTVQERIDERTREIIGQNTLPPKRNWSMANRNIIRRLDDLDLARAQRGVLLDAMQLQISAMFEVMTNQLGPQVLLLAAQAQQTQATVQVEQTKLAANTLADQAQDAWLAVVDAEAKQAKAEAAAAKAEATAAKAATTAQALALTAAQTETAAAKAKAEVAQTKADAATVKAEAAQAKADTATANAATAQANATTAINNAAAASTQAATALATANSAATTASEALREALLRLPTERVRMKRVATVAMPLGGSVTATVTWDKPFADAAYTVVATAEGSQTIGLTVNVISHTKDGVTITAKNAGLAALLANAGTINLFAIHD